VAYALTPEFPVKPLPRERFSLLERTVLVDLALAALNGRVAFEMCVDAERRPVAFPSPAIGSLTHVESR
jgi:hypothetical protein